MGVGLQGVGYDVKSKRWESEAALTLVCFGLTANSTEAELIAIILNYAATMHHIFFCIHNIRIDL